MMMAGLYYTVEHDFILFSDIYDDPVPVFAHVDVWTGWQRS